MKTWAVIPVKPAEGAKSRLAGALDASEREALVRAMLARVHAAAVACDAIDRVSLIGATRNGLRVSVELLEDPGLGLNCAVQAVLAEAERRGIERLVVIHGDLPQISPEDFTALAGVQVVGIAPDRHRTGTNALSLPLPEAHAFRFAFGPDSFALHRKECERLELEWREVFTAGLSGDVDDPADLRDAESLLAGIRTGAARPSPR